MKKVILGLFVFVASVLNGQNLENTTFLNPALSPFQGQITVQSLSRFSNLSFSPSVFNDVSFFSSNERQGVCVSQYLGFDEYSSSVGAHIGYFRKLKLKEAELNLGAYARLGTTKTNSAIMPEGQTGYSLGFGINYIKGYHQIGLSLGNIIQRNSLRPVIAMPNIYPINLRLQTTLILNDRIEFQPHFIYNHIYYQESHDPRVVGMTHNLSTSNLGVTSKFKNVKLGISSTIFHDDVASSSLTNNLMFGYDFKRFSINYSFQSMLQIDEYSRSFFIPTHIIGFRFSPNGFERGSQLF
ncbi:MAG: hypothetical protein ACPGLV_07105 [Bacteroidia bacterium]